MWLMSVVQKAAAFTKSNDLEKQWLELFHFYFSYKIRRWAQIYEDWFDFCVDLLLSEFL